MIFVELGLAVVLLAAIVLVVMCLMRRARRERLLAAPFPDTWRQIVERNVPLYNHLPDALKQQLCGFINVFLDEKHFEGCGGLEMNDEIRVTIAAQALRVGDHLHDAFLRLFGRGGQLDVVVEALAHLLFAVDADHLGDLGVHRLRLD